MYSEMAQYYDRIYSFKDYAAETEKLIGWIEAHRQSNGVRLLDVACGTGRHLELLSKSFDAEGLDLSSELLELARERNPGTAFHCADMRTFEHSFFLRCHHLPVQFHRIHDDRCEPGEGGCQHGTAFGAGRCASHRALADARCVEVGKCPWDGSSTIPI